MGKIRNTAKRKRSERDREKPIQMEGLDRERAEGEEREKETDKQRIWANEIERSTKGTKRCQQLK